MKRLIILAACAALIVTSGCRNCRRRGAPCRSSLSFDPYTAAPAACGVDAVAEPICGQEVSAGYCPDCQPGETIVDGGGYYEGGAMAPIPAGLSTAPPVTIDSSVAPPPLPVGP